MSGKQFKNHRQNDFGGGMNTLKAPTAIQDKEGVFIQNFHSEGSRLIKQPGYSTYVNANNDLEIGPCKVKGMANYKDWLIMVLQRNDATKTYLTLWDLNGSLENASYRLEIPNYPEEVNVGSYFIGDLYVVVTDQTAQTDLTWAKFDGANLTNITSSVTTLTNKKFSCFGFHKGRSYLGGPTNSPGAFYYSKSSTASTPADSYDFGGTGSGATVVGDGSQYVTGFASRQNVGYIMMSNSVWKITDETATQGPMTSKETGTGPARQNVITNVSQDTFYFDGFNVRRLSYEENTLALKDTAIADDIKNEFLKLPKDQSKACAYFAYPYYKLLLRTSDSDENDIAFVYSVIAKSWTIQRGISGNCWVEVYSGGEKFALVGSPFGTVLRDNRSYSYDGNLIRSRFVSKEYAFGDNVDFKRFYQVEFNGSLESNTTAVFNLYVDGVLRDTRYVTVSGNLAPTAGSSTVGSTAIGGNGTWDGVSDFFERFEMFDDGRRFQFEILHEDSGYFDLQGFNLQYKYVNPYPIHY